MIQLLRQRGSVTVELGLLLIPLVVLAFGVTEYGRAIYQYNAIAKGVRDGVRHLSQYAPGDTTRIAEARCLAVYGKTNCSDADTPLVPGLNTGNVTVRDRSVLIDAPSYNLQETGRGTVNLVAVEINGYAFTSLVPFVVPNFRFGTIRATMLQGL
jgi:Flp pilus assembly protein TadG